MKSSVILAASGAVMAFAAALDKRAMETVLEVKWVTVTVTAGQEPPVETPAEFFEEPAQPAPVFSTISPDPAPEPVPAPVVEAAPVVVEPTPAPEPEPVVVESPAPAPVAVEEEKPAEVAAPSDDSMESAALYHHNIHRQNHSAPALEWGSKYAGYAAESAAKCVFEHDLTPGGGGYGQNLAMWGASNGDGLGASKAVSQAISNMWYNGELNLYSPNFYGGEPDMSNFMAWGHFSQVVWVDTKQVGCAVHFCEPGTLNPSLGMWYSVCNYFPAGNMGGAFAENVLPPGSAGTVSA